MTWHPGRCWRGNLAAPLSLDEGLPACKHSRRFWSQGLYLGLVMALHQNKRRRRCEAAPLRALLTGLCGLQGVPATWRS